MPNNKNSKNNINLDDNQIAEEEVRKEEAIEDLPEDIKEVLGFSENDNVVSTISTDKPAITPDLDYIPEQEQEALDEIDKLI